MSGSIVHQGSQRVGAQRVAVVAARFNDAIVSQLVAGAERAWRKAGGKSGALELVRVPGAFELPVAARRLAFAGQFSAIVALGCVVRGDTPHFDFVAGECARGLMQVSLETGVPVIFGVLTTETFAQAEERAAIDRLDKGGEAMLAALEMANLLSRW